MNKIQRVLELFKTPVVKITLSILLIAVIVWYFWPVGMPHPNEALRQTHPLGFSVIVPQGYSCSINLKGDKSVVGSISAEDPSYSHFAPRLTAMQLRSREVADERMRQGFVEGKFQDQPAWIYNAPRGKQWMYRVIAERGGAWFEIAVALPYYVDVPTDTWREYVASFRYDPPAAPSTTTSPG